MKRRCFRLISVATIVLIAMFFLTRAAPAASYTYTTIDHPNTDVTHAMGINSGGDIVGYYDYQDSVQNIHGFVYSGGNFTDEINFPLGNGCTYSNGINDNGDVVGNFYDTNRNMHGFLATFIVASTGHYRRNYSEIDYPYSIDTLAYGINNNDDIVGSYLDGNDTEHGFLYNGSTYTEIDVPNSVDTSARGINNDGEIVGCYRDSSGNNNGFVYNISSGTFTKIDYPNALNLSGLHETYAYGINDNGDVVGYYVYDNDNSDQVLGFLYNGATHEYTTIDVPNAAHTYATGINDGGDIVGYYMKTSGDYGFLVSTQTLWQNAKDLGSGWKWLSWFGYFNTNSSPWIYHQQLGWLYPFGTSTDSIWFWDSSMNAFWWTSATAYPYAYRAGDGAWLWYEAGTSNPRWFYNFKTEGWEKH